MKWSPFLVLSIVCCCNWAISQGVTTTQDLIYARSPQGELHLDLYLPQNAKKDFLIIWVHGGAWKSGDKMNPPKTLVDQGYAMASINYRLSTEAIFPAQIHDIKAAIRYLRANAKSFGLSAKNVILWGSSAGGHLVALAGLSNGDKYLEGVLGNYQSFSSDVQGIIDFYGPTNLESILDQSTPHGLEVRIPALQLLYGADPLTSKDIAKKCSPIQYVDADDPAIFIAHGDQDNQVPINQSIELFGKCKKSDLNVVLEFVYGNGHGGYGFESNEMTQKLTQFILGIEEKN